jgi:uncharacterized phage protein gp47/JayE
MPRFTPKRHEQLLTKNIAKVVTRTRLSDISNSSAFKHVLAASARQDDEQYYQMTLLLMLFDISKASGDDLDERAKEIQPGTVTRNLANKSTGNVVFYRDSTVGTVSIAIGTQVSTSDGKAYTTTAAGEITPTSPVQITGHSIGQDSGLVPVIANVAEEDGNVDDNTVTKFVSKPPGIDGVTNPSPFANGTDKESDDSFRNRLIQYISNLARGTIQALEAAVLGAEDTDTGAKILFAKCVEDVVDRGEVTLYIDDGTGSAMTTDAITSENLCEGLAGPPLDSAVGGEEYLSLDYKPIDETTLALTSDVYGALVQGTDYYVNGASSQVNFLDPLDAAEVITGNYTRYTGLIELGQKIIDGDPNDRINYPGYRAGGVRVIVITPQVMIQTVEVSLFISEGYDHATVEALVLTTIKNYINNLGISGDVIRTELGKRIKNISGIYDYNLISPSANVILLDDQMARTTDANITIN